MKNYVASEDHISTDPGSAAAMAMSILEQDERIQRKTRMLSSIYQQPLGRKKTELMTDMPPYFNQQRSGANLGIKAAQMDVGYASRDLQSIADI